MHLIPINRPRFFATGSERLAFWSALLIVVAFFYWTASTSAGLPPFPFFGRSYTDYYNLLVHGFLKGHLYLDVPVDPAMAGAANPYDPKVWIPHGWMIDSSFYHGRYYIYYGVVPALVLMLPFRLLTGGDLWLGTAGEIATVCAFLALVTLWLRVRRDLFPRTGATVVFASVIALGLATGYLSLARRPMMYEFAIATGSLFTTLMLHSLYSALTSERRAAWIGAAGLFLGLAVGCRPTFLFAMLAPIWVLATMAYHGREERPIGVRIRSLMGPALSFALGFGAMFSGVLLYNYLRFSNAFDFGYNYLLQDPVCDLKHVWSPSYFGFNLRNYYWGSLDWTPYFPFATMGPIPKWPDHYYGVSDIAGILKYAPVVWFSLVGFLAFLRPTRDWARTFGGVFGMCWLAYLGPGLCELFFGNSALRYEVDFLPNLVLASTFGACVLCRSVPSQSAKRLVKAAFLAAAMFSAAVAAILSIPLEGTMTVQRGNEYTEKLARILNIPTFAYESARGWEYGPLTWNLTFGDRPPNSVESLATAPNAELEVQYLAGNRIRFGLKFPGNNPPLWGEEADALDGKARVVAASFGSLYPGAESPYYLKRESNPIYQSAAFVALDGHALLQGIAPLSSISSRDIHYATGRAASGWFSGEVHEVSRNPIPADQLMPDMAPRTVRLTVGPGSRVGRFPLISSGLPGAGDLLFLDTEAGGMARFGYFSSGHPVDLGPDFPLTPGVPIKCMVQMNALHPFDDAPGALGSLAVVVDGRLNWESDVPSHSHLPDTFRLGSNSVASPNTEPRFPGVLDWIETEPCPAPSAPTDHVLMKVVFPTQTRWGLSEPLLFTGIPGAYDGIGVVHYGNDSGRFFLEHYGTLHREGPILQTLGGESVHDIEIITPAFSLFRGSREPGRGTIIVRMDGQEVLRFYSDLYPARVEEANVGTNPFGGSTERRFMGTLLDKRWVGRP